VSGVVGGHLTVASAARLRRQVDAASPAPVTDPSSLGPPPSDPGTLRAEAARALVKQLQDKKAVYGHETVPKTAHGQSWTERKEGWWWEETEFDCSKFALWVLAGRQVGEQAPTDEDVRKIQVAPFGRVLDASSVSAMLSIVDGLVKAGKAKPIRTEDPALGDLMFWEGHIAIVVEVRKQDGETYIIFAHMGTSGAGELGRLPNGTYWLKVSEIAKQPRLGTGKFLGFWTP
jgi:hypothetical protein